MGLPPGTVERGRGLFLLLVNSCDPKIQVCSSLLPPQYYFISFWAEPSEALKDTGQVDGLNRCDLDLIH